MKKNKVWFVTGASKGLGLSLVKQLLAAGYKVAATSRTTDSLKKAVGSESDDFLPLEVDLANDKSVQSAIAKTKAQFGRVDVAVNNAGYGIGGSMEELSDKEVRESFDINVFGTINVIRHVLPVMREQQSGHIINISSIAGIAPGLGWSVYGAAKHAVIGLTEVLAEDVKSTGIKATVVAPGGFRTNFNNPDSVVFAKNQIDAYSDIRATHGRFSDNSGHQKGDPEKAAKAMIDLAENPAPPVYLLLGTDAYDRALKKIDLLKDVFIKDEAVARSTDY